MNKIRGFRTVIIGKPLESTRDFLEVPEIFLSMENPEAHKRIIEVVEIHEMKHKLHSPEDSLF